MCKYGMTEYKNLVEGSGYEIKQGVEVVVAQEGECQAQVRAEGTKGQSEGRQRRKGRRAQYGVAGGR